MLGIIHATMKIRSVIIQIEMREVWIVFRFRTTLSENTRGWY